MMTKGLITWQCDLWYTWLWLTRTVLSQPQCNIPLPPGPSIPLYSVDTRPWRHQSQDPSNQVHQHTWWVTLVTARLPQLIQTWKYNIHKISWHLNKRNKILLKSWPQFYNASCHYKAKVSFLDCSCTSVQSLCEKHIDILFTSNRHCYHDSGQYKNFAHINPKLRQDFSYMYPQIVWIKN